MTEVPATARMLAGNILSHEARGNPEPDLLIEAIARVETRLRERLSQLIGMIGYTTLIARALRLAQVEIPELKHVTVNKNVDATTDGLIGIRDFVTVAGESSEEPGAIEAGLTAILAYVIGLLSTFIGEDLALRLVGEGWPDLGQNQSPVEG